jgi:hypothetical protein
LGLSEIIAAVLRLPWLVDTCLCLRRFALLMTLVTSANGTFSSRALSRDLIARFNRVLLNAARQRCAKRRPVRQALTRNT